jgi:hypothetical protein
MGIAQSHVVSRGCACLLGFALENALCQLYHDAELLYFDIPDEDRQLLRTYINNFYLNGMLMMPLWLEIANKLEDIKVPSLSQVGMVQDHILLNVLGGLLADAVRQIHG